MSEKFSGFTPPEENWSKLPHAFIEAMPMVASKAEMCIVLYILRHTWGYREYEEAKRISTDEFANGRKRRDGTRIDSGVGMSFPSIRSGIKSAIEHGFIEVETDDTDKARIEKFYSLKMSGVKSLPSVAEGDGKKFTISGKDFTTVHRKKLEERNSEKETVTAPNGASASANGKKPAAQPRRVKNPTNKQEWMGRLEPVDTLVHSLLVKFDEGYAKGLHATPAEYVTVAHLKKYVPVAEELRGLGAKPDEITACYTWAKAQYDAKGWTMGLSTILEKYQTWKATTATPAAPKPLDEYSAWRLASMQAETAELQKGT